MFRYFWMLQSLNILQVSSLYVFYFFSRKCLTSLFLYSKYLNFYRWLYKFLHCNYIFEFFTRKFLPVFFTVFDASVTVSGFIFSHSLPKRRTFIEPLIRSLYKKHFWVQLSGKLSVRDLQPQPVWSDVEIKKEFKFSHICPKE